MPNTQNSELQPHFQTFKVLTLWCLKNPVEKLGTMGSSSLLSNMLHICISMRPQTRITVMLEGAHLGPVLALFLAHGLPHLHARRWVQRHAVCSTLCSVNRLELVAVTAASAQRVQK